MQKRGRNGPAIQLKAIQKELGELEETFQNGFIFNPRHSIKECVDVANFAMMLADVLRKKWRLVDV